MSWNRFRTYFINKEELGVSMDVSRMNFSEKFMEEMKEPIQQSLKAMSDLEAGAIANPDEGRMVGHYWLRSPELAPNADLAEEIKNTLEAIKVFAAKIHSGEIQGPEGRFEYLLVVGIGGSALGPQFVSQALGHPDTDAMQVYFFDNTDPDGMDLTLTQLKGKLAKTLVIVISKSGGTPETRNGMLEAQAAFIGAGLNFSKHAVAITGEGSKLDKIAENDAWLARFPMWDWVGGRTSETGPVGLLPAALQGIDIDSFLTGAAAMDIETRKKDIRSNPAAMLALMWYHATNGKGEKDMVILPYKDRLALFSKYLQQLVMESLGKEYDLQGNVVCQGIAVYGNKGSTDQHAYVQELREGVNNFFVTFIEVLNDRQGVSIEVDPGITSGDYLQGFLLGTREALTEKKRESITITVESVTPESVGQLIALYERAVGLYAHLIGINAYHQPGVEAGKNAAASILEIKVRLQKALENAPSRSFTVEALCKELALSEQEELVFKLLEHLSANPATKSIRKTVSACPFKAEYQFKPVL